jgi:SAM-dependent methyltransferase
VSAAAPGGDAKDTQSYWKGRARAFAGYYAGGGLSLRHSVSAFLDSRTRLLHTLAGWDERSAVLDLGCGSGVHVREIAPRCREVVGVDYSHQMLKLAEAELRGLPRRNWSLLLADAAALPLPAARFDWIVSMGLLDYVASPPAVILECRRVLRPGGTLLVSLPKTPSLFAPLRTRPGDWLKARLFDLPPIRNVFSRAEVVALLRERGLELRELHAVWTTMWVAQAVATAP